MREVQKGGVVLVFEDESGLVLRAAQVASEATDDREVALQRASHSEEAVAVLAVPATHQLSVPVHMGGEDQSGQVEHLQTGHVLHWQAANGDHFQEEVFLVQMDGRKWTVAG